MKIEIPPEIKALKRKYRYTDYFKDKLWTAISIYVVKRDTKKYGSKCIACGMVKELQCGHYCPAQNCGLDLNFDPNNLHGECEYDNGFNEGHLIGYRKGLIARYGEPYVEQLEKRYDDSRYRGVTFKISKLEYIQKIMDILKMTEEL